MEFNYDGSGNKKDSIKYPVPDKTKEQTIQEIFKLKPTDAPDEDHLIQHNALGTWGKKPKTR